MYLCIWKIAHPENSIKLYRRPSNRQLSKMAARCDATIQQQNIKAVCMSRVLGIPLWHQPYFWKPTQVISSLTKDIWVAKKGHKYTWQLSPSKVITILSPSNPVVSKQWPTGQTWPFACLCLVLGALYLKLIQYIIPPTDILGPNSSQWLGTIPPPDNNGEHPLTTRPEAIATHTGHSPATLKDSIPVLCLKGLETLHLI